MEVYTSQFAKKSKSINKIGKITESLKALKAIRRQIREDEENGEQSLSHEDVISKVEDALIDAIKTLGATDEVTSDLITTVGKLEGMSNDLESNPGVTSDNVGVGYNDENNANMNTDMNEEDEIEEEPISEEDDIIGSMKGEMTSAEEGCEKGKSDEEVVEEVWGSEKEEGVTDATQTTDENPPDYNVPEDELEEDEEMDRETNLRKTGQYEIPGTGKVNESIYKSKKIVRYQKRFK
jgi:hypothetical protein